MAKKAKKEELSADSLLSTLADALNNSKKGEFAAAAKFLHEDGEIATVPYFVSSGVTPLDLAIANRPNGGFPGGKIIEVTGLEASGKSLLCAHAIANVQKMGGIGVFIDTESAVSPEFFRAIGVDVSKMLYVKTDLIEEVFASLEQTLFQLDKAGNTKPVVVVIDSIAATSHKAEMEAGYDKDGYATQKAIIISKSWRKLTNLIDRLNVTVIVTNQLRQKLGVMFGDPWTTSGGKSTAFHSSVRLRLKSVGQIKGKVNDVDRVVGIQTEATVIKNRLGPPLGKVKFNIYFSHGVDDAESWLEALKTFKVITNSGKKYTYVDKETGEEVSFEKANFAEDILSNTDVREAMYRDLCDAYIMEYSTDNQILEEVEIDENVIGEHD